MMNLTVIAKERISIGNRYRLVYTIMYNGIIGRCDIINVYICNISMGPLGITVCCIDSLQMIVQENGYYAMGLDCLAHVVQK